jgi:NAD(P)-dependent dehydrogenase (short-subunit alcohol dehydrogenase family)
MNRDPDYSAAYVVLRTELGEGHGFCFTIGRGNDVCVAAIRAYAPLVTGRALDLGDLGGFAKGLLHDARGDVTDDASVRRAVDAAAGRLGGAMAADHVGEGIRVNCVNPGTADTPWIGRLLDAAGDPVAERAALDARQPMGRLVSPGEVAAAIAYLASPLAGATTGTALAVDGGMQGLRVRPRGR